MKQSFDNLDEITDKVGAYASFYAVHAKDLMNIKRELMKDFSEKNTYTPSEYNHYKAGVASFILFFEQCLEMVESSTEDTKS